VSEAMFEITEEQISQVGLTGGIAVLIVFMLFIVWDLARKSGAGRLGTFVLFFVLAFGMLGFIAKQVIKWMMGL
jgi:hypothetical protein